MAVGSISRPSSPPFARDTSTGRRYSADSTFSSTPPSPTGSYSMLLLDQERATSEQREKEALAITVGKMKEFMSTTSVKLMHQDSLLSAQATLSRFQTEKISSLEFALKNAQEELAHLNEIAARSHALEQDFARVARESTILQEKVEGLEADAADKAVRIERAAKVASQHSKEIVTLKCVVLASGALVTAGFGGAMAGAIAGGAHAASTAAHGLGALVGAGVTGYGMTVIPELNNLDKR